MNTKKSMYMRVAISAGLLGLLFWIVRGQYGSIFVEIKKTNLALFALALSIYSINVIFCTLRFKTILKGEKIKVPFIRLVELTYIGFFFNNFMPSAIGGDIVKAYYTGKVTRDRAKAYLSVFMDRVSGLFSFAGIGCVALAIGWKTIASPAVKRSVIVFVFMCFLAGLVVLNPAVAGFISRILSKIHFKNIGHKLNKIYKMLHDYRNRKMILARTFAISLFSQVSYFTVVYILFRAVNLEIDYAVVFLIMPLVSVVSLLPSLGGLGLREGAMVALFGPIVGTDMAFGVSVLLFAVLFFISMIGGIIYLVSPQFRMSDIKTKEEFV